MSTSGKNALLNGFQDLEYEFDTSLRIKVIFSMSSKDNPYWAGDKEIHWLWLTGRGWQVMIAFN